MPEDKNKTAEELKEEAVETAEAAEETKTEETEAETKETAEETTAGEEAAGEEAAGEETADEETAGEESASESEAGEAAQEESTEESTKGRRFWQKQGKAPKKDKKDELIEELNDKVARQLAEFENFRKRTEKEKLQNYTIGAKDALEKILPVLDNFERGLANADLSDPFADGMDKVYKQFVTTLEALGVTPIDAAGKEFDPNFHNAVMHVDDENFGENIVVEELQKGYMYKDHVLRYSMVKVAN